MNERSQPAGSRPPLWATFGTLLSAPLFIGIVIVYVPYAITGWRLAPPLLGWEPGRWIGLALILPAAAVMVDFAVRLVREGHGTPMPMAPPQRLVRGGAFRFVRNPAYLAAVTAMIGQALWFGSIGVLAYAIVMALVYHVLVVGYEEPTLRGKFGAAYEEYCRKVPRWLPRIGRRL
jgi:protein-S-isoprenylcysteine O-methyltransferase Ste14